MDIRSGTSTGRLSNFMSYTFCVDGIQCNSMEGFLQSLKFKNPDMQKEICLLVGVKAKYRGKKKAWWKTQILWWRGKEIDRHGEEYQKLLDKAYNELAKNQAFRKALLATGNAVLTHSIGKSDPRRTVLTEQEFVSRLMRLREVIRKEPH